MKLRVVALAVLLTPLGAVCSAQVSFPVVQVNQRLIEHTGHEKTLQGQMLAEYTMSFALTSFPYRFLLASLSGRRVEPAREIPANSPRARE
jgi:hypothetical protein